MTGRSSYARLQRTGTDRRRANPANRRQFPPPDVGSIYRPEIHPTMVATVALFLTAAVLAVLTVGGVLPPLGPVTGLPA